MIFSIYLFINNMQRIWRTNGKTGKLHRDGDKYWYVNGKLHTFDSAAGRHDRQEIAVHMIHFT